MISVFGCCYQHFKLQIKKKRKYKYENLFHWYMSPSNCAAFIFTQQHSNCDEERATAPKEMPPTPLWCSHTHKQNIIVSIHTFRSEKHLCPHSILYDPLTCSSLSPPYKPESLCALLHMDDVTTTHRHRRWKRNRETSSRDDDPCV